MWSRKPPWSGPGNFHVPDPTPAPVGRARKAAAVVAQCASSNHGEEQGAQARRARRRGAADPHRGGAGAVRAEGRGHVRARGPADERRAGDCGARQEHDRGAAARLAADGDDRRGDVGARRQDGGAGGPRSRLGAGQRQQGRGERSNAHGAVPGRLVRGIRPDSSVPGRSSGPPSREARGRSERACGLEGTAEGAPGPSRRGTGGSEGMERPDR